MVKKLCCFIVLVKFFFYLCPDEKYQAYLDVLLEWVMLLIIAGALLQDGEVAKLLSDNMENCQKQLEEAMQVTSEDVIGDASEEEYMQRIVEGIVNEAGYGSESERGTDAGRYGNEREVGTDTGRYGNERERGTDAGRYGNEREIGTDTGEYGSKNEVDRATEAYTPENGIEYEVDRRAAGGYESGSRRGSELDGFAGRYGSGSELDTDAGESRRGSEGYAGTGESE